MFIEILECELLLAYNQISFFISSCRRSPTNLGCVRKLSLRTQLPNTILLPKYPTPTKPPLQSLKYVACIIVLFLILSQSKLKSCFEILHVLSIFNIHTLLRSNYFIKFTIKMGFANNPRTCFMSLLFAFPWGTVYKTNSRRVVGRL